MFSQTFVMNFLVYLSVIGFARGWDNQGHRIIGLIAGRYVKDRTATYLEKTLDEFISVNAVPEGLAYVSIQADMKQNDTAYAWASPMHYAYTDEQCSPYNEKMDCPGGVCIVSAIAKFSTIASDPKASLKDRQEALMFLIHFMGDIHQPLHVGFWKDDGGSKLWLSDPDTHLHDVWDSVIVTRYIKKEAPNNLKRKWNYYTLADDLYGEMERIPDYQNQAISVPVPSDTSNYKKMNAYAGSLATETTGHYTCKLAYRNERGRSIQPGDMLTKTYLDDRWKIVKQQYMVAGYRLAMLLDTIAETFVVKDKEMRFALREKSAAKIARSVAQSEPNKFSNRFNGLPVDSGSDSEDSHEEPDDDKKKPVVAAAATAPVSVPKKPTFAQIITGQRKAADDVEFDTISPASRRIIKKTKKRDDLRGGGSKQ